MPINRCITFVVVAILAPPTARTPAPPIGALSLLRFVRLNYRAGTQFVRQIAKRQALLARGPHPLRYLVQKVALSHRGAPLNRHLATCPVSVGAAATLPFRTLVRG